MCSFKHSYNFSLSSFRQSPTYQHYFNIAITLIIIIYLLVRRILIPALHITDNSLGLSIAYMLPSFLLAIIVLLIVVTSRIQRRLIKSIWIQGFIKAIPALWILFEYYSFIEIILNQYNKRTGTGNNAEVEASAAYHMLILGLEGIWLTKYIASFTNFLWIRVIATMILPIYWLISLISTEVENKGFLLYTLIFIGLITVQQSIFESIWEKRSPNGQQGYKTEDGVLQKIQTSCNSAIVILSEEYSLEFATQKFYDRFIRPYEYDFKEFLVSIKDLSNKVPIKKKGNTITSRLESISKSLAFRRTRATDLLSKKNIKWNSIIASDCDNLLELLKAFKDCEVEELDTTAENNFTFLGTLYMAHGSKETFEFEIRVTFLAKDRSFIMSFEEMKPKQPITSFNGNNDNFTENLILTLSHELNTPLGLNISLLDKASKQIGIPSFVRTNIIKPSLLSARLLHYVVSDIIDFLCLSNDSLQLRIRPINIKDLAEYCISLLREKASLKGLKLMIELNLGHKRIVYTDKSRLVRIILNLLSNALKFTNQGCIKLQAISSQNTIKFVVEDDGIGITPATQRNIEDILKKKELGKRPSSNSSGIGLGLFLANELAIILNPSAEKPGVTFESKQDIGSKFTFVIEDLERMKPETILLDDEGVDSLISMDGLLHEEKMSYNFSHVEDPECSNKVPLSKKVKTLRHRNTQHLRSTLIKKEVAYRLKTLNSINLSQLSDQSPCLRSALSRWSDVLVVDDEPFNILAVEVWLKELNCSYHSITKSTDVINHILHISKNIKKPEEFYKMIILDLNMPSISGIEIAQELTRLMQQNLVPHVTLVAHSAYPKEQYQKRCKEAGMEHYLQKPLRKAHLVNLVKKLVKKENDD